MPETDPKELLSASEAAEVVHVTEATVTGWAKAGKLRHIVLPSGQRRFRREDIEAILVPVEPVES